MWRSFIKVQCHICIFSICSVGNGSVCIPITSHVQIYVAVMYNRQQVSALIPSGLWGMYSGACIAAGVIRISVLRLGVG